MRQTYQCRLRMDSTLDHGLGRIFPGNAVVKRPDGLHVRGNVAGWMDQGAESACLTPIIKKAKHDRDTGPAGNVVESRFPTQDMLARSGRSYGQYQVVVAFKLLNRLLDQIVRLGPFDGDAAQPLEKALKRPAKDGCFPHPADSGSERKGHQQREGQIPVRGMRRADQHEFRDQRQPAFRLPAGQAQNQPGSPV